MRALPNDLYAKSNTLLSTNNALRDPLKLSSPLLQLYPSIHPSPNYAQFNAPLIPLLCKRNPPPHYLRCFHELSLLSLSTSFRFGPLRSAIAIIRSSSFPLRTTPSLLLPFSLSLPFLSIGIAERGSISSSSSSGGSSC